MDPPKTVDLSEISLQLRKLLNVPAMAVKLETNHSSEKAAEVKRKILMDKTDVEEPLTGQVDGTLEPSESGATQLDLNAKKSRFVLFESVEVDMDEEDLFVARRMHAFLSQALRGKTIPSHIQSAKSILIAYELTIHNLDKYALAAKLIDCEEYSQLEGMVNNTLKKEDIFPVSAIEKSPRSMEARFYCNRCELSLSTIGDIVLHFVHSKHAYVPYLNLVCETFECLRDPQGFHATFLNQLLTQTSFVNFLTQKDILKRKVIFFRIKNQLRNVGFEFRAQLFGSSVHGLGYTNSDININLDVHNKYKKKDQKRKKSEYFDAILKTLENSDLVRVENAVVVRSTCLKFFDSFSGFNISIHLNYLRGVEMTELIKSYISPNMKVLSDCLRYLGKITKIESSQVIPGFCFSIMVISYLLHENLVTLQPVRKRESNDASDGSQTFTKNFSLSVAWVKMLNYFRNFEMTQRVMSIAHKNGSFLFPTRKGFVIKDPLSKGNLLKITKPYFCNYIWEVFVKSSLYFGVPRTKESGFFDLISRNSAKHVYWRNPVKKRICLHKNSYCSEKPDTPYRKTNSNKQRHVYYTVYQQSLWKSGGWENYNLILNETQADIARCYEYIPFHFEFSLEHIMGKFEHFDRPFYLYGFPMYCHLCNSDDHDEDRCQESLKPLYPPVINIPFWNISKLSALMIEIKKADTLTAVEISKRENVMMELETCLYPYFKQYGLKFDPYGSFFNGFGTKNSDLDICVTFPKAKVPPRKVLNKSDILVAMELILTLKSNLCSSAQAICSAKCPILKFKHRETGIEGDIGPHNALGMENSKLLKTYSDIDDRVTILGCFLKKVAKICGFGTSSQGTLSSYALIIMLIHFLQRCNPPVLPVLQQLTVPKSKKRQRFIKGWDVYYYSNVSHLESVWPHYKKNKKQVGLLWVEFLSYFSSFDFTKYVVSISEPTHLPCKKKKMLSPMAIVDPFEKSHNLSCGLNGISALFILDNFRYLFDLFNGSKLPIKTIDSKMCLDLKILKLKEAPFENLCSSCFRIGHTSISCRRNPKSLYNQLPYFMQDGFNDSVNSIVFKDGSEFQFFRSSKKMNSDTSDCETQSKLSESSQKVSLCDGIDFIEEENDEDDVRKLINSKCDGVEFLLKSPQDLDEDCSVGDNHSLECPSNNNAPSFGIANGSDTSCTDWGCLPPAPPPGFQPRYPPPRPNHYSLQCNAQRNVPMMFPAFKHSPEVPALPMMPNMVANNAPTSNSVASMHHGFNLRPAQPMIYNPPFDTNVYRGWQFRQNE